MAAAKGFISDLGQQIRFHLDSEAIPIFLAEVSETELTGISSGEHTISPYEVLARAHGPKIVPQIDTTTTSVKTLSLSAGAFALHEACSKKVAGALEKHPQTICQTALVTALAKHSSLIVEAYTRLFRGGKFSETTVGHTFGEFPTEMFSTGNQGNGEVPV
ncbi:ARM repeat superfamily protein [Perilla frutescens var. hirtella]|nr:ARM repeat superfamily protein [Perilla frutescens var. hirtella]